MVYGSLRPCRYDLSQGARVIYVGVCIYIYHLCGVLIRLSSNRGHSCATLGYFVWFAKLALQKASACYGIGCVGVLCFVVAFACDRACSCATLDCVRRCTIIFYFWC